MKDKTGLPFGQGVLKADGQLRENYFIDFFGIIAQISIRYQEEGGLIRFDFADFSQIAR